MFSKQEQHAGFITEDGRPDMIRKVRMIASAIFTTFDLDIEAERCGNAQHFYINTPGLAASAIIEDNILTFYVDGGDTVIAQINFAW